MFHKKPSFLNGTFVWKKLGYNYFEKPSVDLLTSKSLFSDNPWIVLAATLEHAKSGNFTPVADLKKLITLDSLPVLVRGCIELLGNVGTEEALQVLKSAMVEGPDWLREEACGGARSAGNLWLVPWMLEAWHHVSRHKSRENISLMLSFMLSEESYPIFYSNKYSDEEYHKIVIDRLKVLRKQINSVKVPIWRGKLFGVHSSSSRVYNMLLSEEVNASELSSLFTDFRQKFEASTGINCSSFFKEREFQPLNAAAVVEEFLSINEVEKFEEGVRYFFGHRIPDKKNMQ